MGWGECDGRVCVARWACYGVGSALSFQGFNLAMYGVGLGVLGRGVVR